MELQKRKPNRLKDYDYNSAGAYFITICTQDKKCILGTVVGTTIGRPPEVKLSDNGKIIDNAINNISKIYPSVTVDKYVIMPNHIHLLLQIHCPDSGRPVVVPTISTIIQQMKGYVTKQVGYSIWQRHFHDHITRSEKDYTVIYQYIESNSARWAEGKYYQKASP